MSDEKPTRRTPYVETFDDGPGGWISGVPARNRPLDRLPTEVENGALLCRGPWWIDYNHAPPGGGYLHLLGYMHTHPSFLSDYEKPNRFIDGGYSRDFTNARLTVRVRGEIDFQGSELVLLAQADVPGTRTNYVLTGQSIAVTPEWSETTLVLSLDPSEWQCLGTRWDRTEMYGYGEIRDVLADLNCDIIFVLFPLDVVPLEPIEDMHHPMAGRDYEVDRSRLPTGWLEIDTVRLEYP